MASVSLLSLLSCSQRFRNSSARKHWRLACRPRAKHRERFSRAQVRADWEWYAAKAGGRFSGHGLIRGQPQHGLVEGETAPRRRHTARPQLSRPLLGNDHNLYRALQKMQRRDPICRRENSKLLRHSSKRLQRLLCLVPIIRLAGVMMQSQSAQSLPSDFPPAWGSPAAACAGSPVRRGSCHRQRVRCRRIPPRSHRKIASIIASTIACANLK